MKDKIKLAVKEMGMGAFYFWLIVCLVTLIGFVNGHASLVLLCIDLFIYPIGLWVVYKIQEKYKL